MKLLKEWDMICRALGTGRQILLLRKGGIEDDDGRFTLAHPEFYLYPGLFHQTRDALKPRYYLDLELSPPVDTKKIHLQYFAHVTDALTLTDWNVVKKLDSHHLWSESFVKQRFEWKQPSVTLLILRTYRLHEEITLPMKKEYGGCKSWVEAASKKSMPAMSPALSDGEFAEKRNQIIQITSSLYSIQSHSNP